MAPIDSIRYTGSVVWLTKPTSAELFGIAVRVATPDDATLQAIQALIAGTPGVDGVRLQSLVLGGESVLEIVSAVPLADLRYALDRRGLRLEGGTLRRRASGEAALPPPVPEVQEEQLQESPGPEGGA